MLEIFRLRLDRIVDPQFSFGKLSGRRDLNSPAKAEIDPVAERVARLRGCVSTQALHSGGDTAKVGGGVRGPMGGGSS